MDDARRHLVVHGGRRVAGQIPAEIRNVVARRRSAAARFCEGRGGDGVPARRGGGSTSRCWSRTWRGDASRRGRGGPAASERSGLARTARRHGHCPANMLGYARQAFGVRRPAATAVTDIPAADHFAMNPPKEMIQRRLPRPRPEALRNRRARIARPVARLFPPTANAKSPLDVSGHVELTESRHLSVVLVRR